MWVSRRQAQNAADAGALAGAISLLRRRRTHADREAGGRDLCRQQRRLGPGQRLGRRRTSTSASRDPARRGPDIPPCGDDQGLRAGRRDPQPAGSQRRRRAAAALPTFFASIVGLDAQGVAPRRRRETASGNTISACCRSRSSTAGPTTTTRHADTTFFPNDAADRHRPGGRRTTMYDPAAPGDVYIAPYGNNPAHTGWTRRRSTIGRQLILKDGSPGNYSPAGPTWSTCRAAPARTTSATISSTATERRRRDRDLRPIPCTAADEPNGCLDVKTGVGTGPIKSRRRTPSWRRIRRRTGIRPAARSGRLSRAPWSAAHGMDEPAHRPIAVIDINHYDGDPGCSGSTLHRQGRQHHRLLPRRHVQRRHAGSRAWSATIPSKDVVGRIVTLPGSYRHRHRHGRRVRGVRQSRPFGPVGRFLCPRTFFSSDRPTGSSRGAAGVRHDGAVGARARSSPCWRSRREAARRARARPAAIRRIFRPRCRC